MVPSRRTRSRFQLKERGGYFNTIREGYKDAKVFVATMLPSTRKEKGGELDTRFEWAQMVVSDEGDEAIFDYLSLTKIKDIVEHEGERIFVSATLNHLLVGYIDHWKKPIRAWNSRKKFQRTEGW